jgi:DNA-binding SARP family transcriptional activator
MTREIQALLAYLLLNRHRPHPRAALADIFWGIHGQEKARGSLNTTLWKLKKSLEPEAIPTGTYLQTTHSCEVGFNKECQYWLDARVKKRTVASDRASKQILS